ncbi:DUF3365 domain-containing protein [Curvibacter sp. RS43]|uniref:Tll0287-like domain-containing protein n=1 Tax=Curvibacter microcysteis TaxID=3026419 RepID=UPI002360EC4B|nr:DUF3365 domain-containing protein [Curvibacter sp. RS43]MDD0812201.1 DUF3365 domain-containing protein [Curvibacter sp. RS43]
MRLETRFAGIIALCFVFGVVAAGCISYRLEARQAQDEIKQKADMVLETALAVRAFTSEEVTQALATLPDPDRFHAAQVPSFAAQSAMHRLADKLPGYKYRESSLNPTNVNDRATDWEVGLLRQFQGDPNRQELIGEVGEGAARQYYVARPIRMSSSACLQCHSVPAAAPKAMLARYGSSNGFGWQMGDVVGLQLVQVATAPAEQKALNSVVVTIGSITSVFVLSAAVMLLLLRRHVTHPLAALTQVALASSLERGPGGASLPVAPGEFSDLQKAILRLKSSVDQALRLMDRRPPATASPSDKKD